MTRLYLRWALLALVILTALMPLSLALGGQFNREMLAFRSDRGRQSRHQLYLLDVQLRIVHPLRTPPGISSYEPDWSPEGDRLVFYVHDDQAGQNSIMLIGVDGGGLYQLPSSYGGAMPAWSPDGQQIAYVNGDYIHLFDLETEEERIYAGGLSQPRYLDWSPDGSALVFVQNGFIYRMSLPEAQIELLVDVIGNVLSPVWSPDGQETAFAINADGQSYDLYVANADGSSPRPLLLGEDNTSSPTWSSDGEWLAFWSDRDSGTGATNYELYRLHLESGEIQRLTYSPADDRGPVWRP